MHIIGCKTIVAITMALLATNAVSPSAIAEEPATVHIQGTIPLGNSKPTTTGSATLKRMIERITEKRDGVSPLYSIARSDTDHNCRCVLGSPPNNACMTPLDCRAVGGRCMGNC